MSYKTIQLSKAADIIVGFPFASEKFNINAQGTRLVRGKNITTGNLRWGDDTRWWDDSSIDLSKYMLKADDIVIGMDGSLVGKNYAKISENDLPLLLVQRVACIRAKEGYDQRFLWGCIASGKFERYIDSIKTGTSIPHISGGQIGNYLIPNFDLPTQKKIAAILSALDEKIAINREINENLERQAASIFAGWLNTCTDFSTIGDMAHNILDYSPVASEQIRLLNSSDVTEGVFPVVPLVPNKDLKGHFKKRFKFGDILYSEIRPRNHHYGFVLFDASDYIASTRLMVIRAIENKVSPAMLYQYLLLPEVEAEFTLKTESRSGTFPQGNYADMASIQVPYSPTNSQTAVSEILSRIRFAIAQNQFESQRLAELRDALLPKLMSGEIDVSAVQL